MSEQELFGLMAIAEENTKAAALAVGKIAEERAALANTVTNLNTEIAVLKIAVESAAAKGVKDSLTQAPEATVTAFNDATERLNKAAGAVQSSANWIGWKLAGIAALVGVLLVSTGYGIARYSLPSKKEIDANRAELAELEANIDDLVKRGGRINLTMCGGRICALASTNQGKGNENWLGPWKSNDDVPLVILRGY